jgi:ferredoxin
MKAKPDSIDLAYFSGTGNNEYLARLLAEKFSRRAIPVRLIPIEALGEGFTPPAAPLLGLVYPIHALNAPSLVFDFIAVLPPGEGRRAFIVKGPADPFFNGGSSHLVIRALKNRGWEVFHESMVVMPSNIFLRYPDDFISSLLRTAKTRLERITGEITVGIPRLERPGPVCRFLTRYLSRLLVRGGKYFGRDLRVSPACDHCGLCVRRCPVGNIRQKDGKIVFGDRCIVCMRCLYICPRGAISPRYFKFFKLKRWYDLTAFSVDGGSGTASGQPGGERGIFRLFRRYLASSK